ncbi:MAG: site-specific integrase [Actinomycetota bacterium]|nr:site-specific integrase [Actinomycetota bacterium]
MSGVRDGVIKRGGTWSYVIRAQDPTTGRSRPRWVGGFPTEAAAKAARDEARVAARRGAYIDRSALTVAAWLREWLGGHSAVVKPKTAAGYRDILELHVIPAIGGSRMQALRPSVLSKLYADLAKGGGRGGRPLSPTTIRHVHALLRKALGDAVTERVLAGNPAEQAKLPRTSRPVGETQPRAAMVWSADELAAFLAAVSEHRLAALFRVLAFTGMRRGEALALRWADLDLDAGELRVARSVAVIAGQRVVDTPKSGRARNVTLDAGTVAALREHRKRQTAERLAHPAWQDSGVGLVFTTDEGAPVHPSSASHLFAKRARAAGLPPLPLHGLRHTHASILLAAGTPVHEVAERLGHATPVVTMTIYAHVLRDRPAGVADAFAAAVERA